MLRECTDPKVHEALELLSKSQIATDQAQVHTSGAVRTHPAASVAGVRPVPKNSTGAKGSGNDTDRKAHDLQPPKVARAAEAEVDVAKILLLLKAITVHQQR